MDLYNLYIIAADMEQENTGSHTFNFDQYFQGQHAQEAKTFAWSLDAEDFYEKDRGAQVRMRPTALPSRCSTISSMRSTRGSGPAPPRRSDSHMPKPLFRLRHC